MASVVGEVEGAAPRVSWRRPQRLGVRPFAAELAAGSKYSPLGRRLSGKIWRFDLKHRRSVGIGGDNRISVPDLLYGPFVNCKRFATNVIRAQWFVRNAPSVDLRKACIDGVYDGLWRMQSDFWHMSSWTS